MLIDKNDSILLLVDIQEKLIKKIHEFDNIITYSKKLVEIFSILKLPVIYSEQYPNGLGKTVDSIEYELKQIEALKIEKTSFSCISNRDDTEIRKIFHKNQIIICGIETHICILQTAIDLYNKGYEVFIIDEAVGSRDNNHKNLAFDRLTKLGISLINFEMLLFELTRDSKDENFKELSKYIIK
tara:strand:- start:3495 stop:4046 length:552 start_codon:yes stop_codon:yes gene_type:complete